MAVLLIEFISSLNIPELLVKSHLNVVSSLRCPGELSREIKVSMPNCKGGNNIPPPHRFPSPSPRITEMMIKSPDGKVNFRENSWGVNDCLLDILHF